MIWEEHVAHMGIHEMPAQNSHEGWYFGDQHVNWIQKVRSVYTPLDGKPHRKR